MGKRTKPVKFAPELEKALDETGLDWHIEPGSKHFKLRLAGRMISIIPQGVKRDISRVCTLKTIATVRRVAGEIKGHDANGSRAPSG